MASPAVFRRPIEQRPPAQHELVSLPGSLITTRTGNPPSGHPLACVDRAGARVVLVDEQLVAIASIHLPQLPPAPEQEYHEAWALSPDRRTVYLLSPEQLRIARDGRWIADHPYRGWPRPRVSNLVAHEGGVSFAIPQWGWSERWQKEEVDRGDLVTVSPDGDEVERVELRSTISGPEGFSLYGRPGRRELVVDAGFGQDGSTMWWHAAGSEPIRLSRTDRIASDVSPSGDEVVTTPHDDGGIEVFAWGEQEPAGVLASGEVFAWVEDAWPDDEEDGFDYYAWFLDDGRLLAKTRQGRLLVIDRPTMQPAYELALDAFPIGEVYEFVNEITRVSVLAPERLLVSHRNGTHHLYRLPT